MDSSDQRKTDESSIKPVTSLRSHFESISNDKSQWDSSNSRFSYDKPLTSEGSWEGSSKERASLGILRPSVSRSSQVLPGSHNVQEKRIVLPQHAINVHKSSPAPQWQSSSNVRTSPQKLPPSFTVHSPPSPSKASPPLTDARTSLSARLQVRSGISVSTPSSSKPSVTANKPTPNRASKPRLRREASKGKNPSISDLGNGDPLVSANRDSPGSSTASKPSKYNRSLSNPREASGDHKISPFSTPPSSDTSPEAGSSPQFKASRNRSTKASDSLTPNGGRAFPLKHTHALSPSIGAPAASINSPDSASSSDHRSNRPGLPPRPPRNLKDKHPPIPSNRSFGRLSHDTSQQVARSSASTKNTTLPQGSESATENGVSFPPPPKRQGTSLGHSGYGEKAETQRLGFNPHKARQNTGDSNQAPGTPLAADSPDETIMNRRPPYSKKGFRMIETTHTVRSFDLLGQHVCASGHATKAWNSATGNLVLNLAHGEKEVRVTALAFKVGATADQEGSQIWLGTNYGDLEEVDITSQITLSTNSNAHNRREVVKIHRYQSSMWTLDEDGKLCVWSPDDKGLPNLGSQPSIKRVPRGRTFSIVIEDTLWLATGKEIRVFCPESEDDMSFCKTPQPLGQPSIGEVTSGAVLGNQIDRVFLGHSDGKISIYSTSNFSYLGVVNMSIYKINSLAAAGSFIWAGYNTGTIHVLDTQTQPWRLMKEWHAHNGPVLDMAVDRSSLWRGGYLHVASVGADSSIRLWDGLLEDDWLESYMHNHDLDYCDFQELRALVVTWNAGASTPANLRYNEIDLNFFPNLLREADAPDLIAFGFQELVDLEDKRLTAKSLFMNNKRNVDQEHMSHQYRAWRDFLVRSVEDAMPASESYDLLHTASLVGLFSCIFVKTSLRNCISNLNGAEIKRGMGGLHGNKGALLSRFRFLDTSLCFVNCHLAAGQTQTMHRNSDINAILESPVLPIEKDATIRFDSYIGGGDGTIILDHEICILSGDLNYRIDTMGRDAIIRTIVAGNLDKLLERDQLLVSRKRNSAFRLRAFTECPISFNPTYKYDVGTDTYDTSDKHRSPAWCDRIVFRGPGKIRQTDYRRHEFRASDHRPVTGNFTVRVKSVSKSRRKIIWERGLDAFETLKARLNEEAKVLYLRDVLGIQVNEARNLILKEK